MSKKCLNCNLESDDSVAFCPECGKSDFEAVADTAQAVAETVAETAPETAEPVAETDAPVAEPVVDSETPAEETVAESVLAEEVTEAPKKKKKKWWKIAVFTVLPLVLVACILIGFWTPIAGFAVKVFGSDEQYMRFVEDASVKEFSSDFVDYYEKALKNLTEGYSSTSKVSVVLSEDAERIINNASGSEIDLSWINNISFTADTTMKGNLASMTAGVLIDNKNIVSMNCIIDFAEMNGYVGFGDLVNKVIKSDLGDQAVTPELIAKIAPEPKVVRKLAEKYVKLVFDNIDDVSKDTEEVSVKGVEQKLTTLTYTIDEETIVNISVAVLKELKKDKDIKDIIKTAQKVLIDAELIDSGDYYGDLVELVDKTLEVLKEREDFDEESKIELVTYVNGASEIVGRRAEVNNKNVFEYVTVRDGAELASKVVIYDDITETGEDFSFIGKGEVKKNKLNAEYDVKLGDEKIMAVTVVDYDIKSAKQGYINGTARIAIDKDYLEDNLEDDDMAVFTLIDPSLEIKMASSEKTSRMEINLLNKGAAFVGLVVETELKKPSDITVPKDNVVDVDDEDALATIFADIDLDALIAKLRGTSIPEEYIDALESMMNGSSDQGDDYYGDDYYGDDYYGDNYYGDGYGDDYYGDGYYSDGSDQVGSGGFITNEY